MRFMLTVLFLMSPVHAIAHDWYPSSCCSEQDCRPLADSEIEEVPGGYSVTGQFISHGQVQQSPDSQAHACFLTGKVRWDYAYQALPASRQPRCVWVPMPSF